MALEIERKFLTVSESWRDLAEEVTEIRQAYLAITPEASIRVRIKGGRKAVLTVKSAHAGPSRAEFEYPIPVEDAEELLGLRTGHIIEKRRHIVPANGLRWEVDLFGGALDGLVVAEIELDTPDQAFARPDWLGAEITEDPRYYNAALARDGRPR